MITVTKWLLYINLSEKFKGYGISHGYLYKIITVLNDGTMIFHDVLTQSWYPGI